MKVAPPQGWTHNPINSFGRVMAGIAISPRKTGGKLRPYLRVANILDGRLNLDDVKHMLFTEKEFETFSLKPGDILLNEGQSLELVGRPAMYNGEIPDCCFQNSLIQFRAAPSAHQPFFYQLFRWLYVSGILASIASRTTSIAHLGVSRFAGLKISVPPLAEQRRIAEILSIWDAAIEQTEKLIAAKERRKRALMQQLLTGKRRFREFGGEGEHLVTLDDLFKKDKGASQETAPMGSVPYLGSQGMDGNVSEYVVGSPLVECVPTDILLLWDGEYAGKAAFGCAGAVASTACRLRLREAGRTSTAYVGHAMKYLYPRFRALREGSGIPHLPADLLRVTRIALPTLAEQQKIAAVLNTADQEVAQLKDQLAALRRQKQGLMQVLLTGKVRTTSVREDPTNAKS
jgi:type I restriction enzyme S subunit